MSKIAVFAAFKKGQGVSGLFFSCIIRKDLNISYFNYSYMNNAFQSRTQHFRSLCWILLLIVSFSFGSDKQVSATPHASVATEPLRGNGWRSHKTLPLTGSCDDEKNELFDRLHSILAAVALPCNKECTAVHNELTKLRDEAHRLHETSNQRDLQIDQERPVASLSLVNLLVQTWESTKKLTSDLEQTKKRRRQIHVSARFFIALCRDLLHYMTADIEAGHFKPCKAVFEFTVPAYHTILTIAQHQRALTQGLAHSQNFLLTQLAYKEEIDDLLKPFCNETVAAVFNATQQVAATACEVEAESQHDTPEKQFDRLYEQLQPILQVSPPEDKHLNSHIAHHVQAVYQSLRMLHGIMAYIQQHKVTEFDKDKAQKTITELKRILKAQALDASTLQMPRSAHDLPGDQASSSADNKLRFNQSTMLYADKEDTLSDEPLTEDEKQSLLMQEEMIEQQKQFYLLVFQTLTDQYIGLRMPKFIKRAHVAEADLCTRQMLLTNLLRVPENKRDANHVQRLARAFENARQDDLTKHMLTRPVIHEFIALCNAIASIAKLPYISVAVTSPTVGLTEFSKHHAEHTKLLQEIMTTLLTKPTISSKIAEIISHTKMIFAHFALYHVRRDVGSLWHELGYLACVSYLECLHAVVQLYADIQKDLSSQDELEQNWTQQVTKYQSRIKAIQHLIQEMSANVLGYQNFVSCPR